MLECLTLILIATGFASLVKTDVFRISIYKRLNPST